MLVDQHQPVLRLGDDIGRGDLAARDAERVASRVGGGFDRRLGAGLRRGNRLEVGDERESHPRHLQRRRGRREECAARLRSSPAGAGCGAARPANCPAPPRSAAARCDGPASSSARRSPPTISPRTIAGSRKRTSVLAGWTLTSTSLGRDVEEQRQHRVAVARQHVGIGAAHRADQQPVLHRPAVDEQILVVGDAAVEGRQAGDAAQPHALRARNRPPTLLSASSRSVSAATRAGRSSPARSVERPPAVMLEREADLRPRHRQPLHDIEAGGIFAARRAQELAPRRHLGEQLLDRSRASPAAARPAPRPTSAPLSTTRASRPRPRTPALDASAARRWRSTAAPRRESPASRPARSRRRAAWRSRAAPAPARSRPAPCRSRRRRPRSGRVPPPASATAIRVAPASIAFSTSSFNALAGRSTTSPAAMRLTRCSGRRRIDMAQPLDQAARPREPCRRLFGGPGGAGPSYRLSRGRRRRRAPAA